MKHRPPDYYVTGKPALYKAGGSPRHVAKTHGTHNGRVTSWPHVSDAIERPAKLPDLRTLDQDTVRKQRKHSKASFPRIQIAKHLYNSGDYDIPHSARWAVTCECVHGPTITIYTHAHHWVEACRLGSKIIEKAERTMIYSVSAERR